MHSPNKNVMVVGQTPPPWGGQAVMIKKLIDSGFDGIDLHYVPMDFSRDMDEIGRFRWGKLLRLPLLVGRIWRVRFRKQCRILYYPPGGESVTAIVRDIVVLLSCRILFERVVFHAHAGGFTEVAEATPLPIRVLARLAYHQPDLFIQLTDKSPPDATRVNAKRIVNVSCGLHDNGARYVHTSPAAASSPETNLLFVGVISRSKGVMVLLEACALLKVSCIDFHLRVMGRFYSPEFEAECRSFVEQHGLLDYVEFIGVKTGDEKWRTFSTSDVFCFPSYFESENQPLVILESMQFGLPCVASDWRSVSTMVEEGQTGFLVPIQDSEALADRIRFLIQHAELRATMGRRARERFLTRFTDAVWRSDMESVLGELE